jgi:hypothetical protein
MPRFQNNFSLATAASLSLMILLFVSLAAVSAFAQENTSADSRLPLTYSVENTGAHFPAPVFPTFEQLPIIRPLPDPFVFFDEGPRDDDSRRDFSFGDWDRRRDEDRRDTRFASWERRRNQIKASIEKYEIGPKPDCSDCTITASYVPPSISMARSLTFPRPNRQTMAVFHPASFRVSLLQRSTSSVPR